jgi:hypothetical protein
MRSAAPGLLALRDLFKTEEDGILRQYWMVFLLFFPAGIVDFLFFVPRRHTAKLQCALPGDYEA